MQISDRLRVDVVHSELEVSSSRENHALAFKFDWLPSSMPRFSPGHQREVFSSGTSH